MSRDSLGREVPENGHSAIAALEAPGALAHPGSSNGSGPAHSRGLAAAKLLWARETFLLKCALYGAAVFVILALAWPSYYRSTLKLMPPTQDSSMGIAALSALTRTGGPGLGLLAGNLLGMRSSGALFVEVLRSHVVEDQLINRFDLRKVYRARRLKDARKQLEWNTDLNEDRVSGVISITVTDNDPTRASQMANAYVEELNRLLVEVNTSAAHKERVFIEDQLTKVKQELDRAASDFSQFASNNTAIDIPTQGKAMVEAAAKLQGELIASQSELQGLEQIYAPTFVRVKALKARIGELQSQLDKLDGTQAGSANDGPGEAGGYPSIRKLPLLGVRYFDLYRQTKIQEAIYEALNEEYAMAKVQEAKELPNARIFDPPDVPETKSGPLRTLMVFAGMMLSLAGGAVWLLGNAKWNEFDARDPRKQFLVEVASTMKARVRRAVRFKAFRSVRTVADRSSRVGP